MNANFFSILFRLFIILILPLGIFGGMVGIYLRKKFAGSEKENLIVNAGMGLTVFVLLTIIVIISVCST